MVLCLDVIIIVYGHLTTEAAVPLNIDIDHCLTLQLYRELSEIREINMQLNCN